MSNIIKQIFKSFDFGGTAEQLKSKLKNFRRKDTSSTALHLYFSLFTCFVPMRKQYLRAPVLQQQARLWKKKFSTI